MCAHVLPQSPYMMQFYSRRYSVYICEISRRKDGLRRDRIENNTTENGFPEYGNEIVSNGK